MRIIIETTGAEQIAIRPEEQLGAGQGVSVSAGAAMDAGPPREELLQALGEGVTAPSMKRAATPEEPYPTATTGGKPPAWH
jgi:hypothetical protein